jgi:hypothetical protein
MYREPPPSIATEFASSSHIAARRLFEVATACDTWFDSKEFNHLKLCSGCFDRFVQFVRQQQRQNPDSMSAAPS